MDEPRLHRTRVDVEDHLVVVAELCDESGHFEVLGRRAGGDVGGFADDVLAFGDATHGGVVSGTAEGAVDTDREAVQLTDGVEDIVDQGFEVLFGFGWEPAAALAAQLLVGKVFHIC